MSLSDKNYGTIVDFEEDLWNLPSADPTMKFFTHLKWYGSRRYRIYSEESKVVTHLLSRVKGNNPYATITYKDIAYYMLD
jgi:hypothetical protein